MRKLNPITALYFKILELISFLLIELGGRFDDSLFPKNATPEDYEKARQVGKRYRRHCRSMHRW